MRRNIFVLAFALLNFIPVCVNAENSKDYTAEFKKIEDYACEELKGHNLRIGGHSYNKVIVVDETDNKEYMIDLTKKGICEEFKEEIHDDYVPTEYSWEENSLYLNTYSKSFKFVYAKTLDTEIEPNSSYVEKEEYGFVHVNNPITENLSNYYEMYYFELATGEYNPNASYYEIIENKFTTDDFVDYVEEAVLVKLDKNSYEANKYYVIASPVKKRISK